MAIRYYVPKPARPALETDLKTLADAANEAAKREAAQWFYFVTIMITLAAIVGSTTHRVLFLEEPVKVPILGIELPLRGFYVAGPAIFVVLHFYLLTQVRLMARKVRAFLDAVERETAADPAARGLALHRLDTFSVAQLVAADRYGRAAPAVRAMAWVTLVVAPVGLLLFFQLRFLPFHSEGITWWHRGLIAVDLGLVWALWPSLESGRRIRLAIHAARGAGVAFVLLFAVFVATIPDEWADVGGRDFRLRSALFDGEVGVDQRPTTLFSRRLILPDEDLVPEDDKARGEMVRTRVLRGRRLEFAVLDRADLRKADLTGAALRGASLRWVQMQGASLDEAQVQGASFDGAHMQGASLGGALMRGTSLDGAQMQGAWLGATEMQGASLTMAQMQAAWLGGAQMQGVWLFEAQLQGAWLAGAQMQGAILAGAQMQGAWLNGAAAWRLQAEGADVQDATVAEVDFAADLPCSAPDDVCDRARSWAHAVELWLSDVPEDVRGRTRQRLNLLVADDVSVNIEDPRSEWHSQMQVDLAQVAQRLGDLACAAGQAPHVARGVQRQIWARRHLGRDLGPHRAALAARMTGASCPGARGLTDGERGILSAIAAARP